MTNPSQFTESENNVLRLVAAFVQLPGSPMKLSKAEQEALRSAQAKLNENSW